MLPPPLPISGITIQFMAAVLRPLIEGTDLKCVLICMTSSKLFVR